MSIASIIRLLSLAAIWGGAFLLMRIAAPVLGPVPMAEARVALGAVFLTVVSLMLRRPVNFREHWKHYLVLGLFNSALPFLFFGFAARTLSASLMSIINATTPIWGAVIGAVWLRQPLSAKTAVGLVLGVAGVAILVGFDEVTLRPGAALAILSVLGASFSYGVASNYARHAKSVEPIANAHGSMWAATAFVTPMVFFSPVDISPGPGVIAAALFLGFICSGFAYILYFRLIADIGATSALTVTFLVPLFGILWGDLFLDEPITRYTLIGAAVVIVGTALVTGFSPRALFRRQA